MLKTLEAQSAPHARNITTLSLLALHPEKSALVSCECVYRDAIGELDFIDSPTTGPGM